MVAITLTARAQDVGGLVATKTLAIGRAEPAAQPADFRSVASTTYASRTNTTINKPSGVVDGDILLVAIFLGKQGASPPLTAPSGWTLLDTPTSFVDSPGFNGKSYVYWKRAAGEGASYTFQHAAGSSQAVIIVVRDAVISGSPIDASSLATGTGGTTTATGVTTTSANDFLLYISHDWEGNGTLNAPVGMTEVFDGLLYVARLALGASTGPTGNKMQVNGNTVTNAPWAARLIAVKSKSTSATPPAAPVVMDASLNLSLPATAGITVGVVSASGSPTAWSIVSGNSAGYFAIDNSGNVTVTAAGASGLAAQAYNLTVQATNASGNDTGAVSVLVSSAPLVSIPMSWNDARFATNVQGPANNHPTNALNLDWDEAPGFTSGEPCFYVGNGGFTMTKCRVRWREGPRIDTTNNSAFVVDQSYIECVGKSDDHADAFQGYAGTGAKIDLTIKNSFIRAYDTPSAVAKYGSGYRDSTGLFCADNTTGSVKLDTVVFQGGSRLVTIALDTGTVRISFKDVYLIPDPTSAWSIKFPQVNGSIIVDLWQNVRFATIVDGVLIPGALIPFPGAGGSA